MVIVAAMIGARDRPDLIPSKLRNDDRRTLRADIEGASMKVLIAADGSDYTKRMLAYIAAHDEWLGPAHRYTVVHSVPPVPPRAASFVGAAAVQQFHDDDAEAVFRPIRAFFAQQGLTATFTYTIGHAAQSIASMAEEGRFDLIVMGSRGHGDLANLILGSVASQVLARCKTPVLLIR
jgi:nucleotide-binding universal stress UspA family protein